MSKFYTSGLKVIVKSLRKENRLIVLSLPYPKRTKANTFILDTKVERIAKTNIEIATTNICRFDNAIIDYILIVP